MSTREPIHAPCTEFELGVTVSGYPVTHFELTVITPVFNGGDHIASCLDNVRDQGCSGVEHLVVDGGSTDGTLEHARRRMAIDQSVRLLIGPDRGQRHAMNKGIVDASGSIIGFLNADDRYAPGALATATEVLSGSWPL